MQYLLVMPRFTANFGDYYTFPLGIAYVSAAMKAAGLDVRILNLNHSARPVAELVADEVAKGVDLVCTGGLSGHYLMVKEILDAAKAADPRVRTLVGGGLLSSEPTVVMEGTGADFGVIGEGEVTMVELARCLAAGEDPGTVAGLIFRTGEGLQETPKRKEIPDLDSLPWPDYEGFGMGTYLDMVFPEGSRRSLSVAASRSCPYDCTFCYHPTGRKYRQRSLDALFEELDHVIRTYRLDHVNIQDELFSVNRERTSEFCRRIKEYGITWDVQLRVDVVTPELLQELKDSGCHYLSLGIESADDTILKSMRKHITRAKIERALALTREADIEIQGNLIFGDLEETLETAHNSLAWWREHLEYHLDIFFIMVYPGTHLYHEACRKGLIQDRLAFLEAGCPLINVSRMTDEEYRHLQDVIAEHRNTYQYLPLETRLLEPDARACCTVEMVCRKCGRTSRHPGRWIFGTNLVSCPHCMQRHDVEPFRTFGERFEPVFEDLVAQGRRVAIWGAGNIANALMKASPSLRSHPIVLVDSSVSKQGTRVHGHEVQAPSFLEEAGIDTVVIASVIYEGVITECLRRDHPGVGTILTLSFTRGPEAGEELQLRATSLV